MGDDNPGMPVTLTLHELGYLQGFLWDRGQAGDPVAVALHARFAAAVRVLLGRALPTAPGLEEGEDRG